MNPYKTDTPLHGGPDHHRDGPGPQCSHDTQGIQAHGGLEGHVGGSGDALRRLLLDDTLHQVQPVEAGQGHPHGEGDGGPHVRQEGGHREARKVIVR